jgi:thiol-disulfide isomerase/thioredoxin
VESLGESDMSNNNRRSSEAQIYFFSADWCPHCKRAKPEWEKFKTAFDNKTIGTYTMKTISVDCTEGDDPLIQEYSIDGYPTVVMMKDNKRINYDAKISFDNLDKFVTDLTQ